MKNVTCCVCGTVFGMTDTLYQKRYGDGKLFWCPNGHSQVFTESIVTKLEKQVSNLTRERDGKERSRVYWQEVARKLGRSLSATKGVVTKLKGKL